MKEWKTYKLGDIVNFTTGKLDSNAADINGKYPFFTCSPETLKINSFAFNQKAILLAGNNAEGNFSVKYYEGKFNAYQRTYVISISDENVVDYKFLYYALKICLLRFKMMSQGTSTKFLTKSILNSFEIDLPNIETQQSIASILASIDSKIQINRQINDNLEQQAQTLYKSWFVDFEPFKDGYFVESELGLIPEGWEVRDIYKYTDVIYGAPYKSSLFNENKEGYPLIRIRDLKSFAPQFYTQEILPQTEYIIAGDVVAGMDAEFTPYIWQGEKGVLNQRCCKFKGQYPWVSNYYLLNLLKPELEYVQSYKTGTTVSHLGKADIDRFKVITPPESIVKTFSVIVNSLLEQKIKSAYEIRNLTSTRDSLLPKLMAGELKINEIDC